MSPKIDRPRVAPSFTVMQKTHCGKIFITVTHQNDKPFEVFIRFGKAGCCGSAMADGIARLISYGLRSGMCANDAIKALEGIGCHLGANTCLNAVAESIRLVAKSLETGTDINDLIEAEDFATANAGGGV